MRSSRHPRRSRPSRRIVGAALAGVFAIAPAIARADDTVALSIRVAEEDGAPVESEAWIDDQIAAAERLFGPLGVHFRWTLRRPLATAQAHVETRRDRDALGDDLDPGAIGVVIVASLRDVDDPSLMRMGVCWRRGEGKPYLIVSAAARPTVLAHELGHFFGNPHSSTPNNVMSYDRSGPEVFFDDAQKSTIRRTLRLHLERKWVTRLGPARLFP